MILDIVDLYKSFGTLKVIEGLNLSVPDGSIFGFVGINGSGKTTTMKMILGLLEADSGEITVCGERAQYGKTVRSIGYMPDVPEFYSYMKPLEYLMLCGEIAGMPRSKINARSTELLELVGLRVNRKIGGFSRGMRQRLGIAQALLNEPKLLICDEPTSALDPMGRKEILEILAALKGQTTVIFSTHILSDVERICDRVAFLHNGKVALSGLLSDIKKQRSDAYGLEFANSDEAASFANSFRTAEQDDVILSENSLTIKNSDGTHIIALLAKANIVPIKFELLEPSLEDVFLEVLI